MVTRMGTCRPRWRCVQNLQALILLLLLAVLVRQHSAPINKEAASALPDAGRLLMVGTIAPRNPHLGRLPPCVRFVVCNSAKGPMC